MLNEIYVIDDVISKGYQNLLEREIVNSNNFSWYMIPDITVPRTTLSEENITKTMPGFFHYYKDDTGVVSSYFPLILPLVHEACGQVNLSVADVIQCRSFMHMPLNERFHRERDYIHIDLELPHIILLYYVTDSDGDLLIFEKSFGDASPRGMNENPGNILKRVSPKKGRAVIMDGSRYHCSSPPTVGPRVNINFNLIAL
jgi:hypothetical protein